MDLKIMFMNKVVMRRLAILNMVLFSLLSNGFSQDPSKTLGQVNIASPNAASLAKYGDIPVSYHTGIPNISIPLYTVKSGALKLPISLSYHASGLKVDEQDSWVGAGWALNAGGVITRTVKDKPDERKTSSSQQTYGYFSDYGIASYYYPNAGTAEISFDGEPDLFFFNFNGYTGKFYFNDDRTPVFVPEQDFKIEYTYNEDGTWNNSPGVWNTTGRCIEAFTITTPDGTKYYFGIPTSGTQSPYCDPIEVNSLFTSQTGTSYSQVISSWYLYKIVSADGNSSVDLKYKRDKYAFYTFSNPPSASMNTASTVNYKYQLVKNLVAGVQLSQINTANERVDFTPGEVRQDLSNWSSGIDQGLTDYINQSSATLGSISVADNQNACFKKFNFSYGYFTDNTTPAVQYFSGVISDKKRLKLNSLQEVSCDGTTSVPPYSFDYFEEQVPRKLSFSRDHWGFNNGVTTNTQLYPALYINDVVINGSLGIANRAPSWPAMRGGTLNKITYPTGGSSTFDFEPNRFTISNIVNGQTVSNDEMIGGLRIKTISNFDPVGNKTIVTNYSYLNQTTGLSSGVLYSKPTYIQIFRNDWMKKTNFLGTGLNGCFDMTDPNSTIDRPYIFSDNPLRPMETTQGYHIGYGEVKVSQTNNGYSIYKFAVTPLWVVDRSTVAITKITDPNTCSLSIPNYPAAPLPNDFQRGEPNYEGHFNETGSAITEKEFQTIYEENPVTTPGRLTYLWSTRNEIGGADFMAETFYELKTARKTQSTVIERMYQAGGSVIEKQTQTLFESPYHHEPTRIISTDSKGQSLETKFKYAFDYRVPVFENTTNCLVNNSAGGFLNYFDYLYYSSYQSQFNCTGQNSGYTSTCYATTLQSFYTALTNARKNYINCRRTNYTDPVNAYQVNHNNAKDNANAELRPILWMQDIYMNTPIEISEWKNNKLTSASFIKYNNNRDDEFGIYPEKRLKIDLSTPSTAFTSSSVGTDNASISKDSRYTDLTSFDFNKGNVISNINRDGVPVSYDWGYNQNFPVVKISNASNKYKEIAQPGTVSNNFSFPLGPANPTSGTLQATLQQTQTGTIIISLSGLPTNAQATATFTLTGPVNQSGYLCAAGSGGASCSTTPSSISYTNMPKGSYILSATINSSFQSFTFTGVLSYTYSGTTIISSGLKEFFYEGFEENTSSNVITGTAHTGLKYYNANYTVPFTPPNSRSYTIEWWNLVNGVWNYNRQVYTTNMSLSGVIDDVRVFPSDNSLMSTYTYHPLKGLTSEIDASGKTVYYEYDLLGRLKYIRDQYKNIIKTFDYKYQGQ